MMKTIFKKIYSVFISSTVLYSTVVYSTLISASFFGSFFIAEKMCAQEDTSFLSSNSNSADTNSSLQLSPAKKRDTIMQIIDQEIFEVDRLRRQQKLYQPDLQFRKAQLLLEKGRIIKESENEDFLNVPAKFRGKVNKKNYFRQSFRYYLWAKNEALAVVAKKPAYQRSPELFYILGFHEKEFGRENEAINYFQKSEKSSTPNSDIFWKSKSALAEIYYNQKKYAVAIPFYQQTLSHTNDKWWTKDAYNLAWCYFKVRNYNNALSLMKKVIEKSHQDNYVDMSFAASKDIGFFYAESGKIKEGIEYFKSQHRDVVLELLAIADYLRNQGNFQSSYEVYSYAINSTQNQKNKAQVLLSRLLLSDKFFKVEQHLNDSKDLLLLWRQKFLDAEMCNQYILQMKKQVGLLQKQMDNKNYSYSDSVVKYKAELTKQYFIILNEVDKKNSADYSFYAAESEFQAKQYQEAANYYKQAFDSAKEKKNLRIMKLSAEGLLAALGPEDSDFKNRNDYFEIAYKNYLEVDDDSKKSEEIYKRLFRLFYEQGDAEKMKQTLDIYAQHFSHNTQEQDKMVASLLSIYQKKKQNDRVAELVDEVNGGKYFVSDKLKGSVYDTGQKIQMKEIEALLTTGDFDKAKKGYLVIYNDKKSNTIAKANAAYNLMVISFKQNEIKSTYDWALKSIDSMVTANVVSYLPSFVAISKYLFERMQFDASGDLSHRVLAKICNTSQGSYKKILLNNSVLSYRASENNKRIKLLLQQVQGCGIDKVTLEIAQKEYLDYLLENKFFHQLESELALVREQGMILSPYEIEYAAELMNYYQSQSQYNNTKKWGNEIVKSYEYWASRGQAPKGRGLDAYAKLNILDVLNRVKSWDSKILQFPESSFNKTLEWKVQELQKIVDQLLEIQKIGSRVGIVQSYELLAYTHIKLSRDILNFTPNNQSPEYIQSFKNAMRKIAMPLGDKANTYINNGNKFKNQNEVLVDNFGFYPLGVAIKHKIDFKILAKQGNE